MNSQLFSSGTTTSSPSLFPAPPLPSCSPLPPPLLEQYKSPGLRRTTCGLAKWGALCLLPWEAVQAVRLFRTRPPLELSGGCPKGMLTYSRKSQFWWEHQEAVLSPSPWLRSWVSCCSGVWTRKGAAFQHNFCLGANFSPRARKATSVCQSLQLWSVAERLKLPSATCVEEALPQERTLDFGCCHTSSMTGWKCPDRDRPRRRLVAVVARPQDQCHHHCPVLYSRAEEKSREGAVW